MNKMKKAGIIVMVAAAVTFVFLLFGKHINSVGYAIQLRR